MWVYLAHHGDAVGSDVDPQRPLSERGRRGVAAAAAEAASRGARPAVIWHSGKLRARQTAEAFWRACNPMADYAATRGLQPADPPEWLRDQLAGQSRDVLLAGHMPHLARLLRLLRTGDGNHAAISFPLHAVVALERDDEGWHERWRIFEEA